MNPLTVLLWLLCAFVVAVFICVIGLLTYMIKQRKQALKEFNANRIAMGLKPSSDMQAAWKSTKRARSMKAHEQNTKGPSQGG